MMQDAQAQALADAVYAFIAQNVWPQLGWPEYEAIFGEYWRERRSSHMVYVDIFPLLAYQAAGGKRTAAAIPLAAAWMQFIFAARVFDDLFDGEQTTTISVDSPASAVIYGLSGVSGANMALAQLTDGQTALEIVEAFNKAMGLAAREQTPDKRAQDVEDYFREATAKTGIIFATAAWAAARVAEVETEVAVARRQALYDCGLNAGIAVQIMDDCIDVALDLKRGHYTLPVLHGLAQRERPERTELERMAAEAEGDGKKAMTVASLLQEMDSLNWSWQIAAVYQERALAALETIPTADKGALVDYVKKEYGRFSL
jgi:geranylgeranyl pyrophosphate synthase